MSGDVPNFCSLGIAVPTERFQIALTRHAREAKSKLFFLMFNDTLRRIGDYCTVRHWIGGGGDVRMDLGLRGPNLSLEQKHFKLSARSRVGDKFVDANEGRALSPSSYFSRLACSPYTALTSRALGSCWTGNGCCSNIVSTGGLP